MYICSQAVGISTIQLRSHNAFHVFISLISCLISSSFAFNSDVKKLERVSWSCDFRFGPPPEATGCYDDLLLIFDE